jgi:predicted membrane protein
MAMAMTEKMMTPLWMAFMTFFGFLIVGVILSLIVSAFLKRNESIQSFDEQSA